MKKYLILYGTFFLYSIIAVLEKQTSHFTFNQREFYIFYGIMLGLLFLYAIIWQRVLKMFLLTTAYINKGSVFIFNGFWAILVFNEAYYYSFHIATQNNIDCRRFAAYEKY